MTPSISSSKEPTSTILQEEYDSGAEADGLANQRDLEIFHPLLNHNIFRIVESNQTALLIGLKEKENVYLSGIFQLQIVKGGIKYNNVHYNASKQIITFWHPLSNSISGIQSSHYAGWEEEIFIDNSYKTLITEELNDYPCILRIRNAPVEGLLDCFKLYKDVRFLWKIRDCQAKNITSRDQTFDILTEYVDDFSPLEISTQWSAAIENLNMIHRNESLDVRIMVIGGKNSGKSTFLKLLLENFLHGGSSMEMTQQELLYLDLDPGQPEYSHPECISLTEINSSEKVLGQDLNQAFKKIIKQLYVGMPSPQDEPTLYLEKVDKIIEAFENESFVGTSLLNLPGWIKGFGLNILNHIIKQYKPTNIIILESNNTKQYTDSLQIPDYFETALHNKYKPSISTLKANSNSNKDSTLQKQSKFQPSQIRIFKMLALFHKTQQDIYNLKYDFHPLVTKAPVQISYGNSPGICGIQMLNEFKNIHPDDLQSALEGTIFGLHRVTNDITRHSSLKGTFPLLQEKIPNMEYVTLMLLHSIDAQNCIMNVYIPEYMITELKAAEHVEWVITRGKSETPLCEFYPPNKLFWEIEPPFISTQRRKKYEHIWKVRRNVKRRGHHLK
ncbi:hypothetical protein NCAS_0A02950 [Naumovozyma castellii]|uniref:Polynucleotide 5'-hydroxyl-kinase GRC3 n=1 Tax=Naumovozyma castellii TaxID=27288 RepID=G0V5W5_NAUCA|nr:hypothetical protein NCAS_0A02950 [Naumovozyma castellii CBS 4309]CCC66853.1 hypothetical protein NCAS_0A02950 [Naumovozyma castellii CBS 4309]